MHELSFELGIPAHELRHRLPERHFQRYQAHAARWMLPTRRLQVQIARLAMLFDMHMGAHDAGTEFRLADYLYDYKPDAEAEADDLDAIHKAIRFNPVNKAKKES